MNKTPQPTLAEIEELIAFLPKLYAKGFTPVKKWHGGPQEGKKEMTMPWPEYKKVVEDFFSAAGKNCWCDYGYNPNEAGQMILDADIVKNSSINQVKTILTYCVRGERFCDGHWGAMIENGTIRSLLERLAELGSLM